MRTRSKTTKKPGKRFRPVEQAISEAERRLSVFAFAEIDLRIRRLERNQQRVARPPETVTNKSFLYSLLSKQPSVKGSALWLALDKAEVPVLPRWERLAKSRLWMDCGKHSATKGRVAKYLSSARKKARLLYPPITSAD